MLKFLLLLNNYGRSFKLKDVPKNVKKGINDILKEARNEIIDQGKIKANDIGIKMADRLNKFLGPNEHFVKNFIIGSLSAPMRSINNPISRNIGYIIQDSKAPLYSGDGAPVRHKLKLCLGRPVTNTVLQASKQYGSSKIVVYDTSKNMKDKSSRLELSSSFGFNQKLVCFFNDLTFLADDYKKIYESIIEDLKEPKDCNPRIYALNMYEHSLLKISSVNSYMEVDIKFHLIEILDNDLSVEMLFNTTFNDHLDKQDEGAIPLNLQFSNKQSNKMVNKVLCSKSFSLLKSNRFRTEAKIVKTIKKRIGPSDILEFNYRYSCGPGTQLELVKDALSVGCRGLQPTSYFIVMEAIGCDCTAEIIKDSTRIIGTSPGWLQFEMSKGVSVVNNTNVKSSLLEDINTFKCYPVRVFDQVEEKSEKDFNVNINDIGSPTDKNKKLAVVTTSNRMVVSEHEAGTGGKNEAVFSPLFRNYMNLDVSDITDEEEKYE